MSYHPPELDRPWSYWLANPSQFYALKLSHRATASMLAFRRDPDAKRAASARWRQPLIERLALRESRYSVSELADYSVTLSPPSRLSER